MHVWFFAQTPVIYSTFASSPATTGSVFVQRFRFFGPVQYVQSASTYGSKAPSLSESLAIRMAAECMTTRLLHTTVLLCVQVSNDCIHVAPSKIYYYLFYANSPLTSSPLSPPPPPLVFAAM